MLSPALCELVEGLLELHPEERFCLGEQLALVWTMCLSSWSLVVGTCCGATSGQHQEFGRLDEHHRFLPPAPASARLESLKRRIRHWHGIKRVVGVSTGHQRAATL